MIPPFKKFGMSASKKSCSPTSSPGSAVKAVEAFIGILNRGAMDELSQLFRADAEVVFTDACMGVGEYAEEMVRACKAFPDLTFRWESVQAVGDDQAVLIGLRAKGTHKGPYGFGPYPTIEATNTVCQNDPEEVTVWIDKASGKIIKAKFVPKGELTGPPGFYTQIGGLIF